MTGFILVIPAVEEFDRLKVYVDINPVRRKKIFINMYVLMQIHISLYVRFFLSVFVQVCFYK